MAETAKQAFPPALTVLGGPHLMNTARDTLAHVPAVDAVISGRGRRRCGISSAVSERGDLGRSPAFPSGGRMERFRRTRAPRRQPETAFPFPPGTWSHGGGTILAWKFRGTAPSSRKHDDAAGARLRAVLRDTVEPG